MGHRDRTTVAGPVHSGVHRNFSYKEQQVTWDGPEKDLKCPFQHLQDTEPIAHCTLDSDVSMSHMNQVRPSTNLGQFWRGREEKLYFSFPKVRKTKNKMLFIYLCIYSISWYSGSCVYSYLENQSAFEVSCSYLSQRLYNISHIVILKENVISSR